MPVSNQYLASIHDQGFPERLFDVPAQGRNVLLRQFFPVVVGKGMRMPESVTAEFDAFQVGFRHLSDFVNKEFVDAGIVGISRVLFVFE